MATEWTAAMVAAIPDDGNRYEVLDGELAVTPAPSWGDQGVVAAFWSVLDAYVRAHSLGRAYMAPADVEFSPRRSLQPDVFVVPLRADGSRPQSFGDVGRLLLALEVLSPTTARRDRGMKRHIYMEEEVGEYWIVDADAWSVERWRRGKARPDVVTESLVWQPEASIEALVIELPELFEKG